MKTKTFLFSLAAMALMALSACNEIETPAQELAPGDGNLVINVLTEPATKAYTDAFSNDTKVTSIQAVIYEKDGSNWKYAANLTPVLDGSKYTGSLKMPANDYTVAVVVNGSTTYNATNAATLAALRALTVPLTQNSTSNGTVRYGEGTVTVTKGGTASASVTAGNLAFRVTVGTVTVSLPAAITGAGGSLSITGAFLENIYGTCSYSGTITDFKNPGGRADYGGAIVTSSTSYGAGLTFSSSNPADHAAAFYSYPNAVTTDNFNGTLTSGQTAKCRLELIGSWKQTSSATAETVYYPITVDAPIAGKSYDITATIASKGSDDPNKEPQNGTLGVDITVGNWTAGGDIEGNF